MMSFVLYFLQWSHKWYKEERPHLFENIYYNKSIFHQELGVFPKINTSLTLLQKADIKRPKLG